MEVHRLQSDSDQRRLLDGSPLIEGCADGLEFSTANRGADLSFGPRTPRKNALSRAARIGAQLMPSRPYKDLIIYGCFVLNRLVAEMGIDLYQDGLDTKLALVLPNQHGLSKEEVKREIKSNHFMTDRVIESLQKEGHAAVEVLEGHYRIRITREGVLHIRRFNEFYRKVYQEQIRDHYRFTKAPFWLRD